ncbi:MAG: succinate dehydrogenase assembly factor 2 [Lysobacterales bacterium]
MQSPVRQRSARLKWLCRRGMKELDVLLERFVGRHTPELDAGRWPEMELLLQSEDGQLWDWLQHPDARDAAPFRALLLEILDERP